MRLQRQPVTRLGGVQPDSELVKENARDVSGRERRRRECSSHLLTDVSV